MTSRALPLRRGFSYQNSNISMKIWLLCVIQRAGLSVESLLSSWVGKESGSGWLTLLPYQAPAVILCLLHILGNNLNHYHTTITESNQQHNNNNKLSKPFVSFHDIWTHFLLSSLSCEYLIFPTQTHLNREGKSPVLIFYLIIQWKVTC